MSVSAVECFEPDTCVNIAVTGICRLRLRRLDFSCNRIAHIPCDVRKVDTLEELCVNSNPLLSPPAAVSFTCHAACFTWQMRVVCVNNNPLLSPLARCEFHMSCCLFHMADESCVSDGNFHIFDTDKKLLLP